MDKHAQYSKGHVVYGSGGARRVAAPVRVYVRAGAGDQLVNAAILLAGGMLVAGLLAGALYLWLV